MMEIVAPPDQAMPPRRGRPSPQHSAAITATILNAATGLFAREGFEGTSMEAVATLANVPKSTLYKRYPDKGQLLEAVLRKKVQEWSAISTARDSDLTNDLRQRLTRYAASLMTWALDPDVQTFTRLAAVAYGFSGRRAGRGRFFAYDQMLHFIAEDIVRFGPSQRIVSRDPKRVAAALMAFVAGWIESLDPEHEVSPETINREAEYIVSIMIDGNACW